MRHMVRRGEKFNIYKYNKECKILRHNYEIRGLKSWFLHNELYGFLKNNILGHALVAIFSNF